MSDKSLKGAFQALKGGSPEILTGTVTSDGIRLDNDEKTLLRGSGVTVPAHVTTNIGDRIYLIETGRKKHYFAIGNAVSLP